MLSSPGAQMSVSDDTFSSIKGQLNRSAFVPENCHACWEYYRRPTSKRPLSARWRMINRARSRTRARGEHAFRIVKQLWGFAKVRYRGLAKNAARAFTSFALANLYLVRKYIVPQHVWCLY